MKRVDLEKEIRQIQWPELDSAFRERVLAAVPSVDRQVSWSDRWWFSRTWRLSAAIAFVMLAALESLTYPMAPTHEDERNLPVQTALRMLDLEGDRQ